MNKEERTVVENHIKMIEKIIKKIEKDKNVSILDESGSVFYTGYGTLIKPNGVYFLGINPGGDPDKGIRVKEQLNNFLLEKNSYYNAYQDEKDWGKSNSLQLDVMDAFDKLNLCLSKTCGSNLIFERTKNEKDIKNKDSKINGYVYIHDYIINEILNPSIIISFGSTPYDKIKWLWEDEKIENTALNLCHCEGGPCYFESKAGDKILCYIPHSSHSHYKKFSECGHAIEILRSKIKDVMKKRNTSNPPKWKFKSSWQSLFSD